MKHGQAQSIRLHIQQTNENIQFSYSDDGKGFDPSGQSKGYGIENVYTRVAILNGKLEWSTIAGKTNSVSIIIPCHHA